MMASKHAEELAKYALGWTIIKVEPSEGPRETWWKLTLRKGGRTRTLHLGAALGAWVEQVQDDKGKHLHFDSMVEQMTDHLCEMMDKHGADVIDQVTYEAFDDPVTLSIGFRCPLTGREFVSHLSAAKESTFSKRLATVAGRQEFANDVWSMKGIW